MVSAVTDVVGGRDAVEVTRGASAIESLGGGSRSANAWATPMPVNVRPPTIVKVRSNVVKRGRLLRPTERTGEPHDTQKDAPGGAEAPQREQESAAVSSELPHPPQNRSPGADVTPQVGHTIDGPAPDAARPAFTPSGMYVSCSRS
jgi:hypothetical protein